MIAISLLFSVTIKSSVQMMQKLATAMAMLRMMKVAIFSSLSAENRFLFSSFQSRIFMSSRASAVACRFTSASNSGRTAPTNSASSSFTSTAVVLPRRSRNSWASSRFM